MQNGQPVAYASRALTPAETRYAQIEKELLAIVFACDRFEAYVYGRELVNIQSDHKPLEPIFLKSLDSAPKRLQRMLLRLQKYSLQVKYKKGKDMHLADTLSRAYLPEVYACAFTRELEDIDHHSWLPMSEDRWQEFKNAAADDPLQQRLRAVIIQGWQENRADVPESVQPYFDVRDSLIIQNELLFKGQLLVVPTVMRKQMMEENSCYAHWHRSVHSKSSRHPISASHGNRTQAVHRQVRHLSRPSQRSMETAHRTA